MKHVSRLSYLLRTRLGLATVAVGAVLLFIAFSSSCHFEERKSPSHSPSSSLATTTSNLHFTLSRPTVSLPTFPIKRDAASSTNRRPVIFSVHVESNLVAAGAVPFGRLLQCQLVNTLESLTPNTPIIGLVTDDLWFGGDLVIPAGAEVHGQAQLDRVRERIMSTGPWIVVFHSGEQITLTGTALDRELDPSGAGWGMTDGSGGIRGEILRANSLAEVKLFLAIALSGMAEGLQETERTPFGFALTRSARNVAQSGASAVLNTYAAQVLEGIKRDGLYVRVAAGKQFYVYITQTLDAAAKSPPFAGRLSTLPRSDADIPTTSAQASTNLSAPSALPKTATTSAGLPGRPQ